MKPRLLLLNILFSINTLLSSIISGTLIKTPNGYKTVENISIGDELISSDNNSLITSTIIHISKALIDTLIIITTEKGKFYAAPNQQFFDPILQQWIKAQDLTTQNTLLDAQLNHCVCQNIEIIDAQIQKYTIFLPHILTPFLQQNKNYPLIMHFP